MASSSVTQSGSSATERVRSARAALERTARGPSGRLPSTLPASTEPTRDRNRHPADILVLDVLNIYLADKAGQHARPEETKQRVLTLADFWQPHTLADVNGKRCRDYVTWRVGQPWRSAKPYQTGNAAAAGYRRQPHAVNWRTFAPPSTITARKALLGDRVSR